MGLVGNFVGLGVKVSATELRDGELRFRIWDVRRFGNPEISIGVSVAVL